MLAFVIFTFRSPERVKEQANTATHTCRVQFTPVVPHCVHSLLAMSTQIEADTARLRASEKEEAISREDEEEVTTSQVKVMLAERVGAQNLLQKEYRELHLRTGWDDHRCCCCCCYCKK